MKSLRGHGLVHCYLTLISLIYISEFKDPCVAIFVDKKILYFNFFCNLPAQVNICSTFYVLFFVSDIISSRIQNSVIIFLRFEDHELLKTSID